MPRSLSRRHVIRLSTAAALGGCAAVVLRPGSTGDQQRQSSTSLPRQLPSAVSGRGFTPETYDQAEERYRRSHISQPRTTEEQAGFLAWTESRVLQSYLTMYDATLNQTYLDKFVEASQPVLGARDDLCGQVDYRGLSLPGWGASAPYTVAQIDLRDRTGVPAMRITSAVTEPEMVVSVSDDSASTFQLTVRTPMRTETVTGLSLQSNHPRNIVRILNESYPGPAALTASDLRTEENEFDRLTSITSSPMAAKRYIFAVHTAMICSPWAQFSALLTLNPHLRYRYLAPANQLLAAAEAALQVHDGDWRQLADTAGIYAFATGAPTATDGTYLPHNQNMAVARCMTHLFIATKDDDYKRRATSIINLFCSDLSPNSAPVWPYYWSGSQTYRGYKTGEVNSVHAPQMNGQRQKEDPGHGALAIEAIVSALGAGLGVQSAVITRLVGTFFSRVVRQGAQGRWATATRLGSRNDLPSRDLAAVGWIELARWDSKVYATIAGILEQNNPGLWKGNLLSGLAQMVALRG